MKATVALMNDHGTPGQGTGAGEGLWWRSWFGGGGVEESGRGVEEIVWDELPF